MYIFTATITFNIKQAYRDSAVLFLCNIKTVDKSLINTHALMGRVYKSFLIHSTFAAY